MRVVCISDTHGLHNELLAAQRIPDGDVLVHAGDFTDTGDRDEVLAFNAFLGTLPHKYKLVVAGNHESTFDRAFYPFNWQHYGHRQQYDPDEVRALLTNALYLEDEAVDIDGYKFYGSPWQPEFCNWAFNLPRGAKLLAKWQRIPADTDVLVTHTPPFGRGDVVGTLHVGCDDLAREVATRIRPQFHVFGHVHEGYGRSADGTTVYLNASSCTHEYDAVNAPLVFDVDVAKASRAGATAGKTRATSYALMLHEQLRMCSQKPPFVPAATVSTEPIDCTTARRVSLRAFRVDGTTSGLLLESTLKLRPVVGEQTRALRYLFHNGYSDRSAAAAAHRPDAGTTNTVGVLSAGTEATDAVGDAAASVDAASSTRAAQRRQLLIQRRVTMAVLHDGADRKELTDAERQELASAALTLAANSDSDSSSSDSAAAARPSRRSKTLQRREGRVRLASTPEEPELQQSLPVATATTATVSTTTATATATVESSGVALVVTEVTAVVDASPPPPPPAVECVLCKYNVSGHVHPGSSSSSSNAPAAVESVASVPAPAASALLAASDSPAAAAAAAEASTAADQQDTSESARHKSIGASRLSSWF